MRKMEISFSDWCKFEEDCANHGDALEYADCREGVLLDSFICVNDRFTFVAFETYETAWTSYLTVWIAQTEGDKKKLWNKWQEFADTYDAEYEKEEN